MEVSRPSSDDLEEVLQRQVDAAGEGGAGGDGDDPGGGDAGDVGAADEFAWRAAAQAGKLRRGAVGGSGVHIGNARARVGGEPFAEEANPEDRAHGNMRGGDGQAEPAGDDDGDGGGQRHAEGAHRVQLCDRVPYHPDELWPEEDKAKGDARSADQHDPEGDNDAI